jgi:hypothetical protein
MRLAKSRLIPDWEIAKWPLIKGLVKSKIFKVMKNNTIVGN